MVLFSYLENILQVLLPVSRGKKFLKPPPKFEFYKKIGKSEAEIHLQKKSRRLGHW